MTNTLLYGYSTFCLSIHLLTYIWVVFPFWLQWIMLLWRVVYMFLCGYMFPTLLCIYLAMVLLGYMVTIELFLHFLFFIGKSSLLRGILLMLILICVYLSWFSYFSLTIYCTCIDFKTSFRFLPDDLNLCICAKKELYLLPCTWGYILFFPIIVLPESVGGWLIVFHTVIEFSEAERM